MTNQVRETLAKLKGMSRVKDNSDFIKATSEGKLYIKSVDFFEQEKIKDVISKLKESKLIKQIDEKNRELAKA